MRGNKKLIIVISIVLALAVVSAVIAYLYLMTDTFKSKKELFMKYFAQNIESLQKTTNLRTIETYENLNNENKYESNTKITMVNSEGGEVSDPLNNLEFKLDVQKNNDEQYFYADGQILYEDEKYLEAEIIKQEELYGIRFTDAVKQFVSVKNNENLDVVANNMGIEVNQLQEIMSIIDGNQLIVDAQEVYKLKDKYLNIITNVILNGTFEKQKNAMITYNNVTTDTNAYSASLTAEQVKNMLIEILENLKSETEILKNAQILNAEEQYIQLIKEQIHLIKDNTELQTITMTVYEQKGTTIRTVIQWGSCKITIENIETVGELKTQIKYFDNNTTNKFDCEIIKKNTDNQENFSITINVEEGEKEYLIAFISEMQMINGQIELDMRISHEENITTTAIILENVVTTNDFEKAQSLDSNNIVLSGADETRIKDIFSVLKHVVPETTNTRIKLLKEKFGIKDDQDIPVEGNGLENENPQVEINKFNSKFEFYTGDEVSAENVRMLLDIVKNHLKSYENVEGETQEPEDSNVENKKLYIKLNIEKDFSNVDVTEEISQKIDESKKYKVSISYKEENGLINNIIITEK